MLLLLFLCITNTHLHRVCCNNHIAGDGTLHLRLPPRFCWNKQSTPISSWKCVFMFFSIFLAKWCWFLLRFSHRLAPHTHTQYTFHTTIPSNIQCNNLLWVFSVSTCDYCLWCDVNHCLRDAFCTKMTHIRLRPRRRHTRMGFITFAVVATRCNWQCCNCWWRIWWAVCFFGDDEVGVDGNCGALRH